MKYDHKLMSVIIFGVIVLVILICVGISAYKDINGTKNKIDESSKWTISEDFLKESHSATLYIITDPYNRKYLLVKTSTGMTLIPYDEPKIYSNKVPAIEGK